MLKKLSVITSQIRLLFLSCMLLVKSGVGQDSSVQKIKLPVEVFVSALYDFPQSFGGIVGARLPLKQTIVYKGKNNGALKIKNRGRFIEGNLGFYRYSFNHTGLLINALIGTKRLYKNGIFLEHFAGFGALHTFYDGKVYAVDVDGVLKEKRYYGRSYATFTPMNGDTELFAQTVANFIETVK